MIQFCVSMQFSSIWPIDRALPGATTPGQSGSRSDGNKGVLRIPRTSPSDCFASYPGHPSAEMQSVYSITPANWETKYIETRSYTFSNLT